MTEKMINQVEKRTYLHRVQPTTFELILLLTLTILLTDSPFEESAPDVANLIAIFAYSATLLVSGRVFLASVLTKQFSLQTFWQSYKYTLFAPTGIYLLGHIIASLHGPNTLQSLWQTSHDVIVFGSTILLFGWLQADIEKVLRHWLAIYAQVIAVVLATSIPIWLDGRFGQQLLSPYLEYHAYLNGIFGWPTTMAVLTMIGALCAFSLALRPNRKINIRWMFLTLFLCIGVILTLSRAAILALGIGGLLIFRKHYPRLGRNLLGLFIIGGITFAILNVFFYDTIGEQLFPRGGVSQRDVLWAGGLQNVIGSLPWGYGPGQAFGAPSKGTHQILLEIVIEGGLLGFLGALGWWILPILHRHSSRINNELTYVVISIMTATLVHLMFHGGFFNGLRMPFFFLAGIWGALATQDLST